MNKLPSLALLLGLLAIVRPASAAIFLYTEQVTATGSLGAASYTNQPVTITFTGNTTNVTSGGVFKSLSPGTATVKVGNGATATFTNDVFGVFANTGSNVGIYDVSLSATILSAANGAAVGNYDLTTPIAVTGTASSRTDIAFPTSLGVFVLSSTSTNATFTAAAVPEPMTATFVLLAAAPLALRGRRRR